MYFTLMKAVLSQALPTILFSTWSVLCLLEITWLKFTSAWRSIMFIGRRVHPYTFYMPSYSEERRKNTGCDMTSDIGNG